MKRIVSFLMVFVLVFGLLTISGKNVEAKKKYLRVYSAPCGPELNIKTLKKAKKYIVYRALCLKTKKQPKKKKFKKIDTLTRYEIKSYTKNNGHKYNYFDETVKALVNYAYYVKAIGKKGKVIYNTYKKNHNPYGKITGCTPYLGRMTNAEYFPGNDRELGVLIPAGGLGAMTHGGVIELYRKEKNTGEKFKRVRWTGYWGCINDSAVEYGKTYIYKARSCVKIGKKKFYSKYSNQLEITHTLFVPKFRVKNITEPGVYKNIDHLDVIFEIANDSAFNGESRVFGQLDGYWKGKYVVTGKSKDQYGNNSVSGSYDAEFREYSYNNKDWNTITREGVSIPKGDVIYLKARLYLGYYNPEYGEKEIVYGGNSQDYSESYFVGDFFTHNGIKFIKMNLVAK